MLDWLVANKRAIGLVLSVVGATATVMIFESSFNVPAYVAVGAGVVAYLTMPIMWTSLLDYFVQRTKR
ncbi:MAG TPA: hypothetical protein VKW08_05140 [Xanthobacteraceae bacterium]|nr:hypothetical protein [Xanthobacteraceae bacterium]